MTVLTTRKLNALNRELQILAHAEREARHWDDYPISHTRGAFMRACNELHRELEFIDCLETLLAFAGTPEGRAWTPQPRGLMCLP